MPSLFASQSQQASARAGMQPLWSDYLKTVGIGTTDVLAAVPAGTRYAAELTDTDVGESIASGSQYLQDVIHGWGEDLEAGLSEPAKERLLAEFGSEEFWNNWGSSLALKATRTAPSMAATVGATMFTGGGAPAAAMLAGVSGGLSATQTVDEMYRATDSQSDADLRTNSKLYNQFRKDGLSERDARRELNQVMIGAKPAMLLAVGAATSLFGPEAQIARSLGTKGLGSAYSGGILRRTGKAMGAGAVSETIETGAESIAAEQGAVDVGFQSAINPYRVAAATAEGATLGALFGTVGGIRRPLAPPARPTTNANTRPEVDNPPAATVTAITTPAPGPVSMPGKGSNTAASPPIVPGRVGHTAPTSRVATVPGAKGDAFKKSKGAKGKSNVVPLVQPAPATGTAASVAPATPQVASPAPPGDPGGLVAGPTEVAALASQTAPTPAPVAPAPAPTQAVPSTPAPAAVAAPAPTIPPTALVPPNQQGATDPGAVFGAGTVAAPVTQAVATGPPRPSNLAPETIEQPVAPAPVAPVMEAVPTAPRVLPTVTPVTPVVEAPVVKPVKPKVAGEKDTKRAAKRAADAAVAQTLFEARPAKPAIPSQPAEITAFASELDSIIEQARAQNVQFRKRVGYEKTPASLVWLNEVETLAGKLKNKKFSDADKLEAITKFFVREDKIRSGDVAGVKQERADEAALVKQARTGRAGELAATAPGAATEEQAAVTEQAQTEGTAETTEEGEVTTKSKTVKGVEAPVETREITFKSGKTVKEEVAKAATEEAAPEVSAEDLRTKSQRIIAEAKAKTEAAARARGEKARAEIEARTAAENIKAIKAKAAEAAKPKPLPPDLAEKVEAVKKKAEAKKEAQEAKLPPKVKRKKLVTREAPKPSGKAALGAELAKIEPEPSTAQLEADNASKGHIPLEGMQVAISTAAKTERHGVTPSGSRWSYLYNFSYGHILGTKAPDGKPIDIFLGPEAYPKNPKLEGLPVVIIEQVDPDTKAPDEPKVMYGFAKVTDAVEAYDESYPRGVERRGDVVVMTPREFAQWRKSKEERAYEEPTGEPVSEADVAAEEVVDTVVTEEITPEPASRRMSMKDFLAGKRDSPRVEMNRRVEAYQERSAENEKIAAAFAIKSDKVSNYLDDSVEVLRNSWLDRVSRALYPRFAKRIRELAGDVQVYVVPDDVFNSQMGQSRTTGAFYSMGRDYIVVRESEALNDINFAAVVLHEATHAAFVKAVYSNPKMMSQLNRILSEAIVGSAWADPNAYGLTNIDELMAEAFSNQQFQEFLLNTKASVPLIKELGLDGKFKSMWDVLVRYVGKALGFSKSHDSLFSAVMKVSARLELTVPDLAGPASKVAIRNYIQQRDADIGVYDQAFRIPERLNKRLPSQVRQAPLQQQQGTPWLMALRTMDQIVQAAKGFGRNFYEHLRNIADIIEKIRVSADRYLQESMPVIRELHDLQRKYKSTEWWERFTALVYDETQAQIYADRDLASQRKLTGKNSLRSAYPKARWTNLNAEWNAINTAAPDLAAVRVKAMDFFKEQQNKERIGIIRNSLKVAGFTDPDLAQRLFDDDQTDADIELLGPLYDHIKDASELAKLKGPYFPMMRRGKYVVRALYKIIAPTNAFREIPDNDGYVRTWEFAGKGARKQAMNYAAAQKDTGLHPTVQSVWVDKNTGERFFNLGQPDEKRVRPQDADSEQRFRVTIQNRYVEFYESKREARQVAYELNNDSAVEAGSVQDVVERRFQAGDRQADMMSHQMQVLASSLERRAGYQNLSPNQQNQVVQAFNTASLRLLSQTRIQTKRLPRTNVLGYSRDLTRNTLEYAESVSGYLARLDHQDDLNKAMTAARKEADSANDYGKGLGQSSIMNEMERRVARSVAFEERGAVNDWINRTLAVSFADKLISPAYNLLNSLQVIMTTYPTLAARFGPGRAAVMLLRVYRDIGTGQALKSGLVASKRALREGPTAQFPSIVDDIRANLRSKQELSMLDYIIERGGLDPDAGIEIPTMIETRTGVVGGLDQGINYLQTFGRQMPKSIEAINRAVTVVAAYRLEMSRSGDHDVATRFAQETVNMTQGLYSHTNAAPVFNHPLGKMSFQFKKFGQLIYGMIGHNVGKAIRNAEPGDRAEAVKTLAYMTATHVVMAGALGLPTEPLKWLIIGARQAGLTELTWADVENYEREILASAFGKQLGEIAARGVSRALPEGFAFDMSSRVGLQDLFTFGEPRSADKQDFSAFMWDTVGGAPAGLIGDWAKGSQALMNAEWSEAAERLTPIKMVADAIKSYRTTSEGKKTAAGYESLAPYSIGEAAIRTLGFTPAREAETSEARNYFYSATKRASAERNSLMQDWYQASSSQRGRLWGQIEAFNRGKVRDERLTRSELDKYVKRRRTEERSGLVQSGFRVTRREKASYKKLQGTYNISP